MYKRQIQNFTRKLVGTSVGTKAIIVPLTLASAPYVARIVEASLNEVDPGVIEAAKSMGASTWQIIVKVLLPEAKPSLITNGAIAVTTKMCIRDSHRAGLRSVGYLHQLRACVRPLLQYRHQCH